MRRPVKAERCGRGGLGERKGESRRQGTRVNQREKGKFLKLGDDYTCEGGYIRSLGGEHWDQYTHVLLA